VELADSSVNFVVRPFCTPADYWTVHFALMHGAKRALDAASISIPFPQRDVHLFQEKAG
jgi:small conductance mechanosensitive channel